MDISTDRKINEFVDLVKTKYTDIHQIYVFGSYIKGNATEDSDIDIALVFDKLEDSKRFDTQVQLMLLATQIDTRIEPHPISKEDFNTGNPFTIEIKRNGLAIDVAS